MKKHRFLIFLLSVVFFTTLPISSVYALPENLWDFFDNAGIYYFNPEGEYCTPSQDLTKINLDSIIQKRITENQPFYEKSAKKYNFSWQIIAALHYRENNSDRSNPNNGQGAYQLYSYTSGGKVNRFNPGTITDEEFQRQTDIVGKLITEVYGKDLNLKTDNGVKTMFFRYNGVAGSYIAQARSLGFSEDEAHRGEGSPYVMNLADDQRNSKINPNWKQILSDGGSLGAANQQPGAFVVYASLGGSSGISSCSNGLPSNNGNINKTALTFAWPTKGHGLTPTQAYKDALASTGLARLGVGDHWSRIGASCDSFVAAVMRFSGADPNFVCCPVSSIKNYILSSGKYIEVKNFPSTLQAGDIRISPGHIELVVEVNGILKIASASHGERTAEVGNFYHNAPSFKAYRLK